MAAKTGSESITRDRQRSASLITAQLEIENHRGKPYVKTGSWCEEDTLSKAKAAGVAVLVDPYQADDRNAGQGIAPSRLYRRDPLAAEQKKLNISDSHSKRSGALPISIHSSFISLLSSACRCLQA